MSSARQTPDPDVVGHYRQLGWVKLPGLLSAQELVALRDAYRSAEARPDADAVVQHTGAQAYRHDPRYKRMISVSLFNLRWTHPELDAIVRRLAPLAGRLMGVQETRIWWDQTFVKPPAQDGSRQTVWHQDLPFWPFDRRGALTFWIAVEDVDATMGPLRFVPRSHRIGPLGRLDVLGSEPPLEQVLHPEDLALVDPVASEPLRAGDATVHDALTVHGANENGSHTPRRGWGVSFMPAATLYTGAPHSYLDGLGLAPLDRFDLDRFQVEV